MHGNTERAIIPFLSMLTFPQQPSALFRGNRRGCGRLRCWYQRRALLPNVLMSASNAYKMQQVKKKEPSYKVLLIGDSGVGKTSLIMAALNMEFNVSIPSTIEAGRDPHYISIGVQAQTHEG